MRIRRRPQGQSLSSLLLSDPPAPQPPPNASPRDRLPELRAGDKREEELHPNAAATTADLRNEAARRAALLPQDNVVECSRGLGAQQRWPRPAAADGHRSLENGHRHMPGEPVTNGVISSATATRRAQKEEIIKDDSGGGASGGGGRSSRMTAAAAPAKEEIIKKRRGPAVLLEGSRCSRVNGRGWRCSQPTLVGYSLCEHHLGKGRMRSAAAAAGRATTGQKLGRTEHRQNAPAVTAAPKADVPPPSVSHC